MYYLFKEKLRVDDKKELTVIQNESESRQILLVNNYQVVDELSKPTISNSNTKDNLSKSNERIDEHLPNESIESSLNLSFNKIESVFNESKSFKAVNKTDHSLVSVNTTKNNFYVRPENRILDKERSRSLSRSVYPSRSSLTKREKVLSQDDRDSISKYILSKENLSSTTKSNINSSIKSNLQNPKNPTSSKAQAESDRNNNDNVLNYNNSKNDSLIADSFEFTFFTKLKNSNQPCAHCGAKN